MTLMIIWSELLTCSLTYTERKLNTREENTKYTQCSVLIIMTKLIDIL